MLPASGGHAGRRARREPVEVPAQLTAESKSDAILEQVVGRLSLEPTVSAASWSVGPMLE